MQQHCQCNNTGINFSQTNIPFFGKDAHRGKKTVTIAPRVEPYRGWLWLSALSGTQRDSVDWKIMKIIQTFYKALCKEKMHKWRTKCKLSTLRPKIRLRSPWPSPRVPTVVTNYAFKHIVRRLSTKKEQRQRHGARVVSQSSNLSFCGASGMHHFFGSVEMLHYHSL